MHFCAMLLQFTISTQSKMMKIQNNTFDTINPRQKPLRGWVMKRGFFNKFDFTRKIIRLEIVFAYEFYFRNLNQLLSSNRT